jgi:hypothetical protein
MLRKLSQAPILFAKGCEIFISELTRRAWFVLLCFTVACYFAFFFSEPSLSPTGFMLKRISDVHYSDRILLQLFPKLTCVTF